MTQVDWAQVQPGDILLGRDGKEWYLVERTELGVAVIERAEDARRHAGTFTGAVERVRTAAEQRTLAATTVATVLGGKVIAVEEPGGPVRVPATWYDAAALASHIYLMHAEWSEDIKGTAKKEKGGKEAARRGALVAAHEAMHAPDHPRHGGYIDHDHDPNFYTERPY